MKRRGRYGGTVIAAPAAALALIQALSACVPVRWEEPAAVPARSTPRASGADEPRSARGNPPFYEVYGVRYHVLDDSQGYAERGVASWYGRKFHGRETSSGEIYDMYQMTAAHKTLPLPTQVRVTHLKNRKSVVVTINDRGPFVRNRIIDLSYAAARELDMIGTGTALVEVQVLPSATPATAPTGAAVPLLSDLQAADGSAATARPDAATRLYLQVGAFGDPVNARQLQRELRARGLSNVVVRYERDTSPTLYRVRLGPIADVQEYDALVEMMADMQIDETHLVTEAADSHLVDLATNAPLPERPPESPQGSVSASGARSGG